MQDVLQCWHAGNATQLAVRYSVWEQAFIIGPQSQIKACMQRRLT